MILFAELLTLVQLMRFEILAMGGAMDFDPAVLAATRTANVAA